MPKGLHGQKRAADVIGNAVRVMQIARGEVGDTPRDLGKDYARKGGLKGGAVRAAKLSAEKKQAIAPKAARARWSKSATKKGAG